MKKFLFFSVVFFAMNAHSFADFVEGPITSDIMPWSGWYWPMHSARAPHLYDKSVFGQDGPLKKYDLLVLDKDTVLNPANSAREWEEQDCTNPKSRPACTTGHKEETAGSGHCDAWAAASILGVGDEPKYGTSVGVIPSSDGSVNFLNFRAGDLKGLLVETYAGAETTGFNPTSSYLGYDAITPEEFLTVLRYIKVNKKPAIFDLSQEDPSQVWNYPVYKYSLECWSKNDDSGRDSCRAKIWHPSNFVESFPETLYDAVGLHPSIPEFVKYEFDIRLDNEGKPFFDKGEWTMSGFAPLGGFVPKERIYDGRKNRVNLHLREDEDYKKVQQLIHAAPFVMQVQISQSGNVKYDAYWEWNAASKDRRLIPVKDKPVVPAAGDVNIKLVFSRTMDPRSLPDVYYTAPDESALPVHIFTRNPAWSKTNFENDTLTVTTDVPCVSGKATLHVSGKGIENRDIDGDPSSFAQKWEDEHAPVDENHHFRISQPATPQVVATVPFAEPELSQPNYWKAKEPVEVTSLVKIIFSEKMFESPSDAKYEMLIQSIKIEEEGKIKTKNLSEEDIKTWCVNDKGDKGEIIQIEGENYCEGWIDLAKLAQKAKWTATNNESVCGETTEVSFDYSLQSIPRLLRYGRDYRVTVTTDDKDTEEVDGAASASEPPVPLDGNANGLVDGRPDDNFTLEFSTKKAQTEIAILPQENVPPKLIGLQAYAILGSLCSIAKESHQLKVANKNPREEFVEVQENGEPKTEPKECEWRYEICKESKFTDMDTGLVPVPVYDPMKSESFIKWGKLNVLSWDFCGAIGVPLQPKVVEKRRKDNEIEEEGHCLAFQQESKECLVWGELLAPDEKEFSLDRFPGAEAPPGLFPPDEGESVATFSVPVPWDAPPPDIYVGLQGFFKEAGALLSRFNVKKYPVLIEDITPALLETTRVIALPSSGLNGYERSETIKANLEAFVKGGGILMTFSQQSGSEYTALPGGDVSAAGYSEDQSCYTAGSVLDEYHPIMAGQKDAVFDGGIDGYFTHWPENAKILLRRKKNNAPALIVYPYGQGFVVASTLYTDYAASTGQLSADEVQLMKDLLVWLKNPKDEFTESKPQEQMTLTLTLQNTTTQDANAAKITVLDNAGQTVKEEMVQVSVPAGQTVSYAYTFLAPADLGNYTAHYALFFDAQTVQAQTTADSFSVTEHLQSGAPNPDLQFFVTAPGELFPLNSPIAFTIRLKNNGETPQTLNVRYNSHGGNDIIGTFAVEPHSEATIPYTTASVYWFDRNRFHTWIWDFYLQITDSQGKQLVGGFFGNGVSGIAYEPSVSSALSLDKKSYGPSQAGTATLSLTNTTAGSFTTDVSFSILNPNNQKIYETTKTGIAFAGNEQKTEIISFTLPASLVPGPYTVQASMTQNGQEIGKATSYFTVEKAKVAITPVLPQQIVPSSSNTLSFTLQNTGQLAVNSGQFTLTAKDTEGTSFFTETQPFTLNVAEQKTLSFNIPFPALQFGAYKLSYSATTETGIILGSTSLSAQPLFILNTDKPSYKAGDTAQLSLKVTNPDIFIMDFPVTLSAPSVSFTQAQTVSLMPKEQKTFTFTMPITNNANAGSNTITLTVGIAEPYTQAFSFFVQPAKFTATLDKLEYTLNEQGNVTVTNAGGLDANATYTLSLTDKDGVIVENSTGTLSLPVMASANIPVVFTKPEILSGMYRLSVLLKDTRSSLKFPFEQYVTFSGVSASVSVTPTKSVYTNTETPTMKTKVTPTGNLQNTKLTVKILNPNPKISAYAQVGASASILVDPPYIWFGTMYHGAKRLDPKTNTFTDILPNTYIYALAADNAYVYLGTEAALYRYDKVSGQLANFPITNIRAFSRDGSFLWIGTDKGVRKWDTLNEIVTESYTTQNGLPENPIWTLLSDGNRVCIATFNKGLFMLDKLSKTLTQVTELPDLRIRGMAIDNDALWMATWNGVVKLNRKTQEVMQTFNTAQGLADRFTYSIAVDGNWLWVGTLSGLSKYDKSDNTWKTYTKADGMSSDYVRSLAVDADNVYLGCFMK